MQAAICAAALGVCNLWLGQRHHHAERSDCRCRAQLYGDVRLSIHPPTHTPHMFSWFPIFFPLREPVLLGASQPLEAHMWRCTSHHKVAPAAV